MRTCAIMMGTQSFLLSSKHAAMRRGVTDEGLRALTSAGCGEKLTELTLSCEYLLTRAFLCFDAVSESGIVLLSRRLSTCLWLYFLNLRPSGLFPIMCEAVTCCFVSPFLFF